MANYIDADKLKAEIERLKGQLIRGACAAQIEMETNCKEEAYDEVLSFLSTLESEKPVPNDLEEAAEISFDEAYALTEDYRDFLAKGLTEKRPRPIGPHWFCEYAKNRFIAGAKWQAEQDQETIELAEDHAYFAGSVNEREKMMKEAVEEEVLDFSSSLEAHPHVNIPLDNKKFRSGDKVRIIVLPKED